MNVYSFDYDSQYFPSAPTADIEIFSPDTPDNRQTFNVLIDSGADATILPLTVLQKAEAEMVNQVNVRGISNVGISTWTYLVSIRIGDYTIHQVEVASSLQSNQFLLGRDVLNHFIVTLNGLASVTEISQ